MAKKVNKSVNVGKAAAVAAGIAGLAGLAATTYFFFGPDGKKNQKHAKAWAIKMKGDVIEKLEASKKTTEAMYNEIVDKVAQEYTKDAKASKQEIALIAKDLKAHWAKMSKLAAKGTKKVAKKTAKKSAKKSK